MILNHRKLFSSIDVNRAYLPKEYQYENWNLAALKGTIKIDDNQFLAYGNVGIWLTDKHFNSFTDFNKGLPEGMDNRKVCKVFKSKNNNLFAGTLFGLYRYDNSTQLWKKIELNLHHPRIVDITEKNDTLIVLSRSFLLKTVNYKDFTKQTLPPPENYDGKVSLFKTLWVVHSGEIYGSVGKLFVDFIGVVVLFITITGVIYFINRIRLKRLKRKGRRSIKLSNINKWNLKWHNQIGWITLVFLIITTVTGMFLRPPLLIPIVNVKVNKIPFTLLDTPNAWFDQLRGVIYDESKNRFIIGTISGVYYSDNNFKSALKPFPNQPPISVMGITAFEQKSENELIVGSFSGLFSWNTETGDVIDYIKKQPYQKPERSGPPIGEYVISGYSNDIEGIEMYFDYGKGANHIGQSSVKIPMPQNIQSLPMSLWNVMLEVHTARIYQSFTGVFYMLIIPLTGLLTLFVFISGFVVWFKKHRKIR